MLGNIWLPLQVRNQALIYCIIVGVSSYASASTRRGQRAAFQLKYQKVC